MVSHTEAYDHWIRTEFVELNTTLEEIYFAQEDRADVTLADAGLKQRLRDHGREHIVALLQEGTTDEGFAAGFDLLGNVGLYMAACERHAITQHHLQAVSPLPEASALAMQLGASLGVIPRFATSHLTTHARAIDGVCKRFTSLEAERIFVDYNTRGILAYKRAADALLRCHPLSISHPMTAELLRVATGALQDVSDSNTQLAAKLDVERFFYCVRPYFKPHRVGPSVYRGANAGDFAGINVIDLLLGLCRADDATYSQMLVDKLLFMMPEDQQLLRDSISRPSLMDLFLEALPAADTPWFQTNARAFVAACDAHGRTAAQHHGVLVHRYIEQPAQGLPAAYHENLTASGPPLPVLLESLERLRDLRLAAPRTDIPSRNADLRRIKQHLRE